MDALMSEYNEDEAVAKFGTPEQVAEVAKTVARALVQFLDYSGVFDNLDQNAQDVIIDAVTDIGGTVATTGILAVIGYPAGPVLRRLKERAEGSNDESGAAPATTATDTDAVLSEGN